MLVRGQGWRKVHFNTLFGLNFTGTFRTIKQIVLAVLARDGGFNAILPFQQKIDGIRLVTGFQIRTL